METDRGRMSSSIETLTTRVRDMVELGTQLRTGVELDILAVDTRLSERVEFATRALLSELDSRLSCEPRVANPEEIRARIASDLEARLEGSLQEQDAKLEAFASAMQDEVRLVVLNHEKREANLGEGMRARGDREERTTPVASDFGIPKLQLNLIQRASDGMSPSLVRSPRVSPRTSQQRQEACSACADLLLAVADEKKELLVVSSKLDGFLKTLSATQEEVKRLSTVKAEVDQMLDATTASVLHSVSQELASENIKHRRDMEAGLQDLRYELKTEISRYREELVSNSTIRQVSDTAGVPKTLTEASTGAVILESTNKVSLHGFYAAKLQQIASAAEEAVAAAAEAAAAEGGKRDGGDEPPPQGQPGVGIADDVDHVFTRLRGALTPQTSAALVADVAANVSRTNRCTSGDRVPVSDERGSVAGADSDLISRQKREGVRGLDLPRSLSPGVSSRRLMGWKTLHRTATGSLNIPMGRSTHLLLSPRGSHDGASLTCQMPPHAEEAPVPRTSEPALRQNPSPVCLQQHLPREVHVAQTGASREVPMTTPTTCATTGAGTNGQTFALRSPRLTNNRLVQPCSAQPIEMVAQRPRSVSMGMDGNLAAARAFSSRSVAM